jgi:YD repeat-containing protein
MLTKLFYRPLLITWVDKGYGLAEGEELRKVVEMYDPLGRAVSDPAQASRVVTSYYDSEGRLVRRVLGKAVIVAPEEEDISDRV